VGYKINPKVSRVHTSRSENADSNPRKGEREVSGGGAQSSEWTRASLQVKRSWQIGGEMQKKRGNNLLSLLGGGKAKLQIELPSRFLKKREKERKVSNAKFS